MNTSKPDPQRQYQGYKNRADGKAFETLIDLALRHYEMTRRAVIEKTPEPVTITSALDKSGRFRAHFAERAQPDYKGTLNGGQCVVFEAKHTNSDRIRASAVKDSQAATLAKYESYGAWSFVLVGFGQRDVFRVPWTVWAKMRGTEGHRYATRDDLEEWRVKSSDHGLPLILD